MIKKAETIFKKFSSSAFKLFLKKRNDTSGKKVKELKSV